MQTISPDLRRPVRPPSLRDRPLLATKSGMKRLTSPQNYRVVSGFRVVSYNLLADMYVKTGRESYEHCPKQCLSWEYRRQNILKELLAYRADILCLQEVQCDHFHNFFQPELSKLGYAAVYQRRKSQLYNGEGHVADGCATFFRCNKFNLVKFYPVDYAKLAEKMVGNEQRSHRLMKDNLAIVVILEERSGYGSRFCVANTHLSSGKGLSDVRLFQAASLLKGLEKIDSLEIPVLVCGDMNSEPDTDTHKFLTQGSFQTQKHSMNLESAYSKAPEEHKNETLDYIMYSKKKLKLDGVLKFPIYECKEKMRQLPTPEWSSDHIALVADLRIKKDYRMRNWRDLPRNPWEEELEEVSKVENQPSKKAKMTMGRPYHPAVPRAFPWPMAYNSPAIHPGYLPCASQLIC